MKNMSAEQSTQTYSSFSGCDIVASFNGSIIGELQAISYSINREKVPVYTMGSAEPRSFSRGKRAIAGNLVFISFNRDALLCELGTGPKISKYHANDAYYFDQNNMPRFMSVADWDSYMDKYSNPNGEANGATEGNNGETGGTVMDLVNDSATPVYADEILPFDITISFANEYGQKAVVVLYGVELLNEGIGFSIDAVTTEKAYTFVCRAVDTMKAVGEDNPGKIYTNW